MLFCSILLSVDELLFIGPKYEYLVGFFPGNIHILQIRVLEFFIMTNNYLFTN